MTQQKGTRQIKPYQPGERVVGANDLNDIIARLARLEKMELLPPLNKMVLENNDILSLDTDIIDWEMGYADETITADDEKLFTINLSQQKQAGEDAVANAEGTFDWEENTFNQVKARNPFQLTGADGDLFWLMRYPRGVGEWMILRPQDAATYAPKIIRTDNATTHTVLAKDSNVPGTMPDANEYKQNGADPTKYDEDGDDYDDSVTHYSPFGITHRFTSGADAPYLALPDPLDINSSILLPVMDQGLPVMWAVPAYANITLTGVSGTNSIITWNPAAIESPVGLHTTNPLYCNEADFPFVFGGSDTTIQPKVDGHFYVRVFAIVEPQVYESGVSDCGDITIQDHTVSFLNATGGGHVHGDGSHSHSGTQTLIHQGMRQLVWEAELYSSGVPAGMIKEGFTGCNMKWQKSEVNYHAYVRWTKDTTTGSFYVRHQAANSTDSPMTASSQTVFSDIWLLIAAFNGGPYTR